MKQSKILNQQMSWLPELLVKEVVVTTNVTTIDLCFLRLRALIVLVLQVLKRKKGIRSVEWLINL